MLFGHLAEAEEEGPSLLSASARPAAAVRLKGVSFLLNTHHSAAVRQVLPREVALKKSR